MRDIAAGLLTTGLGFWVYFAARTFPKVSEGYQGPGLFPQLIGGLLIVFGIGLTGAGIRRRSSLNVPRVVFSLGVLQAFLVVVSVVLYLLAAPRFGFVLTSLAMLLLLMVAQGTGLRRALPSTLVAVALIYVLFVRLLRVPLPIGPLGW